MQEYNDGDEIRIRWPDGRITTEVVHFRTEIQHRSAEDEARQRCAVVVVEGGTRLRAAAAAGAQRSAHRHRGLAACIKQQRRQARGRCARNLGAWRGQRRSCRAWQETHARAAMMMTWQSRRCRRAQAQHALPRRHGERKGAARGQAYRQKNEAAALDDQRTGAADVASVHYSAARRFQGACAPSRRRHGGRRGSAEAHTAHGQLAASDDAQGRRRRAAPGAAGGGRVRAAAHDAHRGRACYDGATPLLLPDACVCFAAACAAPPGARPAQRAAGFGCAARRAIRAQIAARRA